MNKREFLKKIIISLICIILFFVMLYIFLYKLGLTDVSQEELQEFILSTGIVAPLIYILITFLQVNILPIPSPVTILVGNYLFNPFFSFVYAYIGLVLGSIFSYFLGKWIGRPFINWLSGSQEKTDEWMSKLKGRENILLFFMFLFPLFPDDILCALAGILPITTIGFIIMQLITRFTTVLGTLIFMSGDIIPFNFWGISLIVLGIIVCFVAFVYCFKNAEKINNKARNIYNKIFTKNNEKQIQQ